MKISSWNVNSVRTRINHLINWIKEKEPDIILLQEIKCINELFPKEEIEDLGYNVVINGQKSYNGVAILSKYKIDEVNLFLPNDPDETHSRYIEVLISINKNVVRVISVYVPNGQDIESPKFRYKLNYFDSLINHLKQLLSYDEILVVGGDFNVAPEYIDVYDPKILENKIGFHYDERKKFEAILNLGFTDSYRAINSDKQEYSWWDYRAGAFAKNQGMRIDHILTSPEASDLLCEATIDKYTRGLERSSDHAPINITINL
ncbi:MAG: exodeoxyribonuclease III [Rickettsiales bacterium]|nr:MAG: exodeoxyribonuclease III [Rickettsiales bacterium]